MHAHPERLAAPPLLAVLSLPLHPCINSFNLQPVSSESLALQSLRGKIITLSIMLLLLLPLFLLAHK